MFFGRCKNEFVIQIVTHDLSVYSFARIAYLQWDCSQVVNILLIIVPWLNPRVVTAGSGSSGHASSVFSHLRCFEAFCSRVESSQRFIPCMIMARESVTCEHIRDT